MKVILQQDVNNLGEEGDVIAVANGYGRNYLLPQKLAVMHNASNLALLAARRKGIEKRKDQKRQDALSLKQRLENEELVINMNAGANGKLFGSVTSATIMEALEKVGLTIEKKRIEVPENTIKTTGNFTVRIRLYGNEDADLTVSVRSEAKTAEVAAEAQKAQATKAEVKAEAPEPVAAPVSAEVAQAASEELTQEAPTEAVVEASITEELVDTADAEAGLVTESESDSADSAEAAEATETADELEEKE